MKRKSKIPRNITSKGNPQDQYFWLDIDHEWFYENFMTSEPDFYNFYQNKFRGDDTKNVNYLQYQLVM